MGSVTTPIYSIPALSGTATTPAQTMLHQIVNNVRAPERRSDAYENELKQLARSLSGIVSQSWFSNKNEDVRQYQDWNYVAISALAEQAARCYCEINKLTPEEDHKSWSSRGKYDDGFNRRPVGPMHPLSRLLRRPNPKYGLGGIVERYAIQLSLTGTAYIWVRKNQLGKPFELYTLSTAGVSFQPPTSEFPEGYFWVSAFSAGIASGFFYDRGITSTGRFRLDARDVIVVHNPNPLTEQDGLSPTNACGSLIDTARQIEDVLFNMLNQGIYPSGIASIDASIPAVNSSDLPGQEAQLNSRLSGPDNAGKVALLHGVTLTDLRKNVTDTVPPEARDQGRDFIRQIHRVPGIIMGSENSSSFAAGHAARQQFNEGKLGSILHRLAESLTSGLAHYYTDDDDIEILLTPTPVNDDEAKLRENQAKVATNIYTIDEIRSMFGDPPHEDPEIGKLYPPQLQEYLQAKSQPQQQPGQPQQPPTDTGTQTDANGVASPNIGDPMQQAAMQQTVQQKSFTYTPFSSQNLKHQSSTRTPKVA